MSISPSHSKISFSPDTRKAGFTLIELLTVVAIILVLAGITFGITRGVQNAQARAKAKAELMVIQSALEQFKLRNGDYPWAAGNPGNVDDNGERLLLALSGFMKFDTSSSTVKFRVKNEDEVPSSGPNAFIDLTKVTMNSSANNLPSSPGDAPTGFRFVDPWGNPYVYRYKESAADNWDNFGYVLYSTGPDGNDQAVDDRGLIDNDLRKKANNIDNIYAGE
ncbi:prepilin-type N-terminal cleavage/methylation domain-containing protein [Coraliomargarita parva]|uniref:prepilin-type N-terminal cleavage/methylation domain-containing protein n=1 Tax=Coraliomargarita parva TaxID=3014050 RepID=UPI0022B2EC6A|nr:prepilin-type N-terminal cleavage/methylation domain-containing protein [Coraliomargarita parva]